MQFEVRRARDEDAEAISQVILCALEQTNAKDYPLSIIERVKMNFTPSKLVELFATRMVFVAVMGRQVVGTASLDGEQVRTVFVHPEIHGQGVGRRLMAEIETAAHDAGVAVLKVPSSIGAEPFYAALGFISVSESFHGNERTINMERVLA